MRNPYRVLGVKEKDDEKVIKKRYRELIRKYHPDENVDVINKEELKKKFEEIQEAYDNICDIRAGKISKYMFPGYEYEEEQNKGKKRKDNKNYTEYDNEAYADIFGMHDVDDEFENTFYNASEYVETRRTSDNEKYYKNKIVASLYTKASECIRNYNFDAALNILQCVEEKNAMWYYLMAKTYQGLGNKKETYKMIEHAVNQDPENRMFREFYNTVSPDTMWYRRINTSTEREINFVKILIILILLVLLFVIFKNIRSMVLYVA